MLNNIKSNKGFTIVELLIVIVVIAILAAISIVAYNGIQNRGKASSAQSALNVVIKKAEAASAAGTTSSGYPTTTDGFLAANAKEAELAGSGITLAQITTAPTKPATIEYIPCTNTGAQVSYWDYSASPQIKVTKTIGTPGACDTVPLSQAY